MVGYAPYIARNVSAIDVSAAAIWFGEVANPSAKAREAGHQTSNAPKGQGAQRIATATERAMRRASGVTVGHRLSAQTTAKMPADTIR